MFDIKASILLSVAILTSSYGLVSGITCQDGWVTYHKSCYWFARNHASTFTEAEHYCRQHGSHLVEIETKDEDYFIRDYLRGMKDESHWIGLTDEAVEGIWKWYTSNTNGTYRDWYPGEPNSYKGADEDCAVLLYENAYDYSWFDAPCSNSYEPICEIVSKEEVIVG